MYPSLLLPLAVSRIRDHQGSSGIIGIPVFSVANLRNPRCCILEAESGGKKLAEFIVGNT
jgi:hypothetical protein